jgi:serine/threonine protein kinase
MSQLIVKWLSSGDQACASAGNLKEAIRQKSVMADGSVKALEVVLLALDIAKACQAIHKHNSIHGDLKPHNVLLTVVCSPFASYWRLFHQAADVAVASNIIKKMFITFIMFTSFIVMDET